MSLWPYLCLFTSGFCWGLGLPFGKMALAATDPAHMILLRFLVAAAVAAPVTLRRPETRRLLRHPAALTAGLCYAIGFLVQFEGLSRSSVTVTALLVGAMPALIAVSAAVTGERVGPLAWLGVAGATLGAMLIAGKPGQASVLGVFLCLVSLPVFLGWLFATRRIPAGPVDAACVSVVLAAVILVPLVVGLHGLPRLDLGVTAWIGLVGQGILSTVAATVCWQLGAPRVSTAAAGVFINVEPLVGSALGLLAFHDRPTWIAALGGVLILAGSLTVVLGERRTPGRAGAAEDAPTPA
ncbi:MAG: DMT family transporter [Caulobacteraceae bacterium]